MSNEKFGLSIFACLLLLNFAACASSYDGDDNPQGAQPAANPSGPQRPAAQTFQIGGDAGHPALRNKEGPTGSARNTAIVVEEGDRIEIRPVGLIREQRKAIPPIVTRQDNNVCTQTAQVCVLSLPIFERRCSCQPFPPFPPFCGPLVCCNQTCQNVHVGDRCFLWQPRCVRTQDQWIETSIFGGLDAPATVPDPAPMKSAALMLTGLKLRFSFADPTGTPQRIDCPISQFNPDADSEKFAIHLSNVEGCEPIFVDGSKSPPSLSLVNGMNEPVSFSQGSLVKAWDGRVLAQPQTATYLPVIDFLGTVSVIAAPSAN